MSKYIVYMHVCPNGKRYIGITSRKPEKRWGISGKRYKDSPLFWNAINKYGWDSIDHQVLFSGLSEQEAKKLEKEMIGEYKSRDSEYGYNLTDGGDGMSGFHHTESGKKKISIASKTRICTDEARVNMSMAHRGSKRSLETRAKMSAAQTGNTKMLGHKQAEETKRKIGEANTGRVFSEETLAKMREAKRGCKRNGSHKCTEEAKEKIRIAMTRKKDVECFTMDGNLVGKYPSPVKAEEETGVKSRNIRKACGGITKSAGGYKWRYMRA